MAYCVSIQKELATDLCPLKSGDCYWQHRASNYCKYVHTDVTPEEFCELVGLPPPDPAYYAKALDDLQKALKS
jgi:hypothetical protein